jgi:hypothetical protein
MIIQSSDTITIYTTALASAVPASTNSYGLGTAPEGLISIASKVVITSSTIQINTNTTYAVTAPNNYSQTITNGSGVTYWTSGQTLANVTFPTIQTTTSIPPNYYGSTRKVTNGCGLNAFDLSSGAVCSFSFFIQGAILNYSDGSSAQIISCPTNAVYRNSGGSFVTAPTSLYPYPVVSYSGGPAIVPRSSAALTAITIIPSTGSEYVYPPMPDYTVQFDGNGATGGSPPIPQYSAPYSTPTFPYTVPGNTGVLTKSTAPSTFKGWNTKADGSGINYGPTTAPLNPSNNTSYPGGASTVLYAVWG